METVVTMSKLAEKQLEKVPKHIQRKIFEWVDRVETTGIYQTRMVGAKGLNDEPLHGDLVGTRSIRLNKAWRLYYTTQGGIPQIIRIERIDKHKY